ncbi:glycosyl hydrolase family 18 protein [Candidatus Woesebacteria bacterium]|nr:glycosyl hydrolase family 18 protein [Candidatus Woesebacteria bacterium]MCD8507667.1 glycosyl hydrolase family 18 protein [Candidatus Woesebacteria bacterium]MCD8526750.1 glycosyl hydrolase family 18 protein [Candidatus Woesebacteria bacterium]MCD8546507.1 glycosyl hydrolase family 18 protein [Candidatus Woesebacteria bacterium]
MLRKRRWLWYISFSVVLLALVLGGSAVVLSGQWRRKLATPLSRLGYIQLRESQVSSEVEPRVLGFLPYWTMTDASHSAVLTDIAYFSVTFDGTGSLVERSGGEIDMGYHRLQSESFETWVERANAYDQHMQITVTLLNNDDITAFLRSDAAQEKAIFTITQLLASYPFEGVVMDLEYSGPVTDQMREQYVEFITDLNTALAEVDENIELSVAVYGSAATRYQIWDVGRIAEQSDYLVVMSYDYHVRSSSTVGPVAPIFGKGNGRWQDDVVSNMRDILLEVPAHKILLGIPFYGYEWTATSDQPGATTFPQTGATATYKRVLEVLGDPELLAEEKWDEDALSPYIVYEEDGQTQFIYYENTRSFSYKLDFVNQIGLGGIAVWALGYEGPHRELWDVVEQKF